MQGEMSIMGREGDLKVTWNSDNRDEVKAAKEQFETLTKKGHAAFRVRKNGEKGEQIREFDPDAEMIILAPQMKGG